MIEKLRILNFQKHKKLVLSFQPGVNVIVGRSDSGKSSVLRALRWLVLNEAPGNSYIRNGGNRCIVSAKIDGGAVVERERKSSSNFYRTSLVPDDFTAFGNVVPEPIAHLFNSQELNFQTQHDKPFWFSNTGGEISRQLNAIVDLSEIDECLKYLNSHKNELGVTVDVVNGRVDEIEKKIAQYTNVPAIRDELEVIEVWEAKCELMERQITILQQFIDTSIKLRQTKLDYRDLSLIGKGCTEVANEYEKVNRDIQDLTVLLNFAAGCQKCLNNQPPSIGKIDSVYQKAQNLKSEVQELSKIIEEGAKWQKIQKELAGELKECLELVMEMDVCPLCGQTTVSP